MIQVDHESPDESPNGSPSGADSEFDSDNGVSNSEPVARVVIEETPKNTDPDVTNLEGQQRAVYRRVRMIDGWRRWRGLFDHDGWPRMWGQPAYRLIYEWEQGPIPAQWTIDHACGEKDCLDHLEAVTRGENLRRRHARERGELPMGHTGMTPPRRDSEAASTTPAAESVEESETLTTEQRRAEVQRLRADGLSLRKIASQLGVSYATVWRSVEANKSADKPTEASSAASVADHDCVYDPDGVCMHVAHAAFEPDAESALPIAMQFTVALFAGVDKPAVKQRTVSLDELRRILSTFETLADKRSGRCWSPTRYADGASSRGNAGVAEVSALVFDCDRVAPDPERLNGVYWLGHTTWSHKPAAPKWRVVIPLAQPVSAASWGDVWRRARAALCPEADPSCKDPSRQYYLPSHSGGVSARATCHDGLLLDPSTLPELPVEERAELRRSPSARSPRKTTGADHSRGEAYMDGVIGKLASMAPNSGRNAALNGAAWTLGRWIAAGALDQSDAEDELYRAAEANGLVADDGQRQCWATIRSGLGAGLQQPIDLDADDRPPARRGRGRA